MRLGKLRPMDRSGEVLRKSSGAASLHSQPGAKIVRDLTEAMVAIEGENMRPVTWVVVEEVQSGDWGIAGNPLSTADVKALAAGAPVGKYRDRCRLPCSPEVGATAGRIVHHHVSAALSKIGVPSRTARAREAARMGIGTPAQVARPWAARRPIQKSRPPSPRRPCRHSWTFTTSLEAWRSTTSPTRVTT